VVVGIVVFVVAAGFAAVVVGLVVFVETVEIAAVVALVVVVVLAVVGSCVEEGVVGILVLGEIPVVTVAVVPSRHKWRAHRIKQRAIP